MDTKNVTPHQPLESGAIDPTFGIEGKVFITVPDTQSTILRNMTQAADGKLYVTGNAITSNRSIFWIACLSSKGSLETSFGHLGFVTGHFGSDDQSPVPSYGEYVTVVKEGDAEFLLLGGRAYGLDGANALARFDMNGNLDTGFGKQGKAIICIELSPPFASFQSDEAQHDSGTRSYVSSTYTVADDKIVITRIYSYNTLATLPPRRISVIIRLDRLGDLDETFNDIGHVEIIHPNYVDGMTEIQSLMAFNGKYVGVGEVSRYREPSGALFVSVNYDGTFDTTFNQTGYLIVRMDEAALVNPTLLHVTEQTNKRILGVGHTSFSTYAGLLISLELDGTFNIQFNGAEPLSTQLGNGETYWLTAAEQSKGRIVAAGAWRDPDNSLFDLDFVLARFLSDGNPDLSFNKKGWTTLKLGPGEDILQSIALGPNDAIVVAGTVGPTGGREGALAGFLG